MTLREIISGGQTGADQAGLYVGKMLGLKTGGVAPPHFMTHEGPNPELLRDEYGLVEGEPDPRIWLKSTKRNV